MARIESGATTRIATMARTIWARSALTQIASSPSSARAKCSSITARPVSPAAYTVGRETSYCRAKAVFVPYIPCPANADAARWAL